MQNGLIKQQTLKTRPSLGLCTGEKGVNESYTDAGPSRVDVVLTEGSRRHSGKHSGNQGLVQSEDGDSRGLKLREWADTHDPPPSTSLATGLIQVLSSGKWRTLKTWPHVARIDSDTK